MSTPSTAQIKIPPPHPPIRLCGVRLIACLKNRLLRNGADEANSIYVGRGATLWG